MILLLNGWIIHCLQNLFFAVGSGAGASATAVEKTAALVAALLNSAAVPTYAGPQLWKQMQLWKHIQEDHAVFTPYAVGL